MNIPQRQIEALTAFEYTPSEARFLYIVAMHSGYFTARQFLAFVDAKRGYRTHSLTQKLITQGHATLREYRRNGCIYHLYSRKLYAQLGHENLRNRRRHRLEAIRTRLLALDFILANQGYQYLETEAEKITYFCNQLRVERAFLPVKLYMGGPSSQPTLRYFVDKFPLFPSSPRPGSPLWSRLLMWIRATKRSPDLSVILSSTNRYSVNWLTSVFSTFRALRRTSKRSPNSSILRSRFRSNRTPQRTSSGISERAAYGTVPNSGH